MLCLSQTTGYAILALSCMSQAGGQLVLAKDIAACAGIPLPYLSKVLHALHRSGLIHGKRGYRGGFMLARPPEEVSLLELAEAVEGKNWLPRCLIGMDNCDPELRCPTHEFWTTERAKIEKELRRVRLNDVAAFAQARGLAGVVACACDDTQTNVRTKADAGQGGKPKNSVSKQRVGRVKKQVGVRAKRKK